MEVLESIFSTDYETIEKLQSFAVKPDYNKIFFEHLGPELNKIFENKKDKVFFKDFLEAAKYEYGFFGCEINLPKAYELYKKYADLNDYFCMYKMHVIYLCEYQKFKVKFNRVLEKIYLLKCFAYLPNYIDDWNIKLFETIDVVYEIAQALDLEDNNLEKHKLFFDVLAYEREQYNLSENDVSLMKCVLLCYFQDQDQSEERLLNFITLNSLTPKTELDFSYYLAKNKSIFYKTYMKLENAIDDSEIEKFYKEVENENLYEFYSDYGNYLLDKTNEPNQKIMDLFTKASNEGYLFSSFRMYQCLINYYEFNDIINNYDKASLILDYLLDEIVFEKLMFSQFIIFMGLIIKYSKNPEKITSKYFIYIFEINNYIDKILIKSEKEKNLIIKEEEFYYIIKAYIYYFGFKGIEEQNLQKALEYLEKGNNITKKIYTKKSNEFFKYIIKQLLYDNKLISNDELCKTQKELINFYFKNLNLKYQTVDCYIMGEDYLKGITRKKDEFNAFTVYQHGQSIFCKTIIDCFIKSKIITFLKDDFKKVENNNKIEEEICGICYINKTSKIFIPCKHIFCSECAKKLEKDEKCPMCRSQILVIL